MNPKASSNVGNVIFDLASLLAFLICWLVTKGSAMSVLYSWCAKRERLLPLVIQLKCLEWRRLMSLSRGRRSSAGKVFPNSGRTPIITLRACNRCS